MTGEVNVADRREVSGRTIDASDRVFEPVVRFADQSRDQDQIDELTDQTLV